MSSFQSTRTSVTKIEGMLLTLQLADKACPRLTPFIIPLVVVVNPNIDALLSSSAVVRLSRIPVAVCHRIALG